MRGRWFGAVVVTALLVLVTACARPVGTLARPSVLPSITPVVQEHAPLIVTNPAFHVGEVGVAYTPPIKLAATGGVAPYHWTIAFGALPDGLALAGDTVSGTPTASGTFSFGVQVFDADSDTAGVPVSINIVPRLTATLVPDCATECTVELGCVTVCGTFGQASGGLPPLVYTRTNGALPSGTTLSNLTLDGTFTGLPGRLQFTVQVTDGFGVTADLSPTYNLLQHIAFSGGSIGGAPNYCWWTGCGQSLPYSIADGTPGAQVIGWQYSETCSGYPAPPKPCPPPAQPSVTASGGYVTINVPSPGQTWSSGYKATLTVLLTDQHLCGAGTYCSTSGFVTVTVQGS